MRRACTTSVVVLLLCASSSYARLTRYWSYSDLLKESDLVVVANAIETKTVANTDKPPAAGALPSGRSLDPLFQQVETTFHVRAVVKGRFTRERLTMVHFRWKTADELPKDRKVSHDPLDILIIDGPGLVEFSNDGWSFLHDKTAEKVKAGADCLLFLKLRKDGKYEPVSGQVDPVDSVRWLTKPRPSGV